jgi:hypothetical protein
MLASEPTADAAKQDGDPAEQTNRQQDLPEAPQIEILETLVANPGPQATGQPVDAGPLAEQTTRDDHHQRAQ